MKEKLNREFLDLRKFDCPINAIELIKSITSNPDVEKDPFYIVDLEDICNKHINWITRLPRVEPHYAIKCNTDTMLLKLLAYLGTGFDCASKNEIQKVLDLGVSPHRIIFANPCKQASMIKYAYKQGVNYMTFDNELELHKIKEHHANAKCVLRIVTNDENAVCRFSMKFGADMASSLKLIKLASELGLDLVGVSFHVGSGQMSPRAFSESIENARRLFDHARQHYGIRMHLLDLGGGYPGTSDSGDLFAAIAKEINRALEQFFPQDEMCELNEGMEEKFRVIAEPGRYYACSAFTLACSVIARRDVTQSEMQREQDREALVARQQQQQQQQQHHHHELTQVLLEDGQQLTPDEHNVDTAKSIMYYINDGVYASFNCLFYDHAELSPILIDEHNDKELHAAKLYKSSVWGPTCDGLDLVVKEAYLPELPLNEFMVFKNMGAYTLSGAVAFNGIPLARCIYVVSQSWDTIKDAFNNETSVDEQMMVINMMKEVQSSTCAAAATLALARVLSVKGHHHEHHELVEALSGAADENGNSLRLSLNAAITTGNCQQQVASPVSSPKAVADQSATVDCAITC